MLRNRDICMDGLGIPIGPHLLEHCQLSFKPVGMQQCTGADKVFDTVLLCGLRGAWLPVAHIPCWH